MDDWLPSGPETRKRFICVVLLMCAVLGVLRFVLAPPLFGSNPPRFGSVLDQTLGDMIATALAGTALAWLLLQILPRPARPAVIEDVPAHEIGRSLEAGLARTRQWWFDGSTGRYQRARVLPELGRLARAEGVSREATIVILDPMDEDLCVRYANYRKGLLSGQGKEWSVAAVRSDLYATLLAARRLSESEPLTITVGLKQTMSILRFDLSDSQLVITKEGRSDPAIRCPAESFYFDAYLENMRWTLKQARLVDMSAGTLAPGPVTRESARSVFREMDLYSPLLSDDAALDSIIAKATSQTHPYS